MRALRAGDWIALAGAAGFLAALFADWFSAPGRAPASGWDSLPRPVLALALAGVALTLALWALLAAGAGDAWNIIPGVMGAVVAPLALVGLVTATLAKPGGATAIEPAAWAGLALAAVNLAGVWLSLHDERRTGPGRVTHAPPPRPAPPA